MHPFYTIDFAYLNNDWNVVWLLLVIALSLVGTLLVSLHLLRTRRFSGSMRVLATTHIIIHLGLVVDIVVTNVCSISSGGYCPFLNQRLQIFSIHWLLTTNFLLTTYLSVIRLLTFVYPMTYAKLDIMKIKQTLSIAICIFQISAISETPRLIVPDHPSLRLLYHLTVCFGSLLPALCIFICFAVRLVLRIQMLCFLYRKNSEVNNNFPMALDFHEQQHSMSLFSNAMSFNSKSTLPPNPTNPPNPTDSPNPFTPHDPSNPRSPPNNAPEVAIARSSGSTKAVTFHDQTQIVTGADTIDFGILTESTMSFISYLNDLSNKRTMPGPFCMCFNVIRAVIPLLSDLLFASIMIVPCIVFFLDIPRSENYNDAISILVQLAHSCTFILVMPLRFCSTRYMYKNTVRDGSRDIISKQPFRIGNKRFCNNRLSFCRRRYSDSSSESDEPFSNFTRLSADENRSSVDRLWFTVEHYRHSTGQTRYSATEHCPRTSTGSK